MYAVHTPLFCVNYAFKCQIPRRYAAKIGRANLAAVVQTYKILRRLQLEIDLFNECFVYIVFMTKLTAIGAVTICGFGAVQFFHLNYAMGAVNCCVVLDAIILFTVI